VNVEGSNPFARSKFFDTRSGKMNAITVYALRFAGGEMYVGITKDLYRRLEEHERRQSPSTKRLKGAFRVIYEGTFPTYAQARSQEKYFKSGAGRRFLKDLPNPGWLSLVERQGVRRPEPCQG
jgi:putative endonuclease